MRARVAQRARNASTRPSFARRARPAPLVPRTASGFLVVTQPQRPRLAGGPIEKLRGKQGPAFEGSLLFAPFAALGAIDPFRVGPWWFYQLGVGEELCYLFGGLAGMPPVAFSPLRNTRVGTWIERARSALSPGTASPGMG